MAARKEELWVVVPDTHAPLNDTAATNCLHKAIGIAQPTGFLHLGDVGEWNSVSHWRWKRRKRPPLEYVLPEVEAEAAQVNEFLDTIDKSLAKVGCQQKVVTLGNHDNWIDLFRQEFPYLQDMTPAKQMRLKDRGYVVHPFEARKFATVGKSKLHAYHGHHVGGVYHARNHCLKLGASVIYGHWHDCQQHSIQTLGGHHAAWSLGCLRGMDAEFLRGAPTNWSHAFGLVHVMPSGNFHVEVVHIEDGMTSLWGRVIDGHEKAKAKKRVA